MTRHRFHKGLRQNVSKMQIFQTIKLFIFLKIKKFLQIFFKKLNLRFICATTLFNLFQQLFKKSEKSGFNIFDWKPHSLDNK